MKNFIMVVIFALFSIASSAEEPCIKKKCKAISGTNTVVITISIDENGYPLPSVMELLKLTPGQRIVFVGPDDFTIYFKGQKSPFDKTKYQSKDGVITLKVPEKIFDDKRFFEEGYTKDGISFAYGVIVNGKELDPEIIVRRH